MIRPAAAAMVLVASLMLLLDPVEARSGGGRCDVCGCKGGPGSRAPDGKCVGHRNSNKVCGVPPSTRGKKES